MLTILAGLATAAAVAGAVAWLRRRRNPGNPGGGGGGGGFGPSEPDSSGEGSSGSGFEYDDTEWQRQQEEQAARDRAAKEAKLRSALEPDDPFAQLLLQLAGRGDKSPREVINDPDQIRRLAEMIDPELVQIISLARDPGLSAGIDLQVRRGTQPVDYYTDEVVTDPLLDMADLPEVLPEQLVLDDDLFWTNFFGGNLQMLQAYDEYTERKRLCITLDVSGSMDQRMNGDLYRRILAAAIVVRYCMLAVAGEAEFLLRTFADTPGDKLWHVRTAAEAQSLMRWITGSVRFDGSGTNISGALSQSAADIRASDLEVSTSDLLLLSDGDDPSLTEDFLRRLMGDDIRLHAELIGLGSSVIREVATTYREHY